MRNPLGFPARILDVELSSNSASSNRTTRRADRKRPSSRGALAAAEVVHRRIRNSFDTKKRNRVSLAGAASVRSDAVNRMRTLAFVTALIFAAWRRRRISFLAKLSALPAGDRPTGCISPRKTTRSNIARCARAPTCT
jgi:hypothetical protein